MLGKLLEFSLAAPATTATLDEFAALGFRHLPTDEVDGEAYAVVGDGNVRIGLYDDGIEDIMPTFVRPSLEHHVRALRRAGAEFDIVEVGAQQFHNAVFRDPAGCCVRLIEARSFAASAIPEASHVSVCGEFLELSVSTFAVEQAATFWNRLGLSPRPQPSPRPSPPSITAARLTGHGLALGLYDAGRFGAALTFVAGNLDGRSGYLRAKGFGVREGTPLAAADHSVTVAGPAGLQIFILDATAARGLAS